MVYRVALADSAKADAYAIYDQVVAAAPHQGPLWFEKLIECLYSLDHLPRRCPLAREAENLRREIRRLLFGKRRNVYRVLYEIDEAGKKVWVLQIRRAARRDLRPEELGSASSEHEE